MAKRNSSMQLTSDYGQVILLIFVAFFFYYRIYETETETSERLTNWDEFLEAPEPTTTEDSSATKKNDSDEPEPTASEDSSATKNDDSDATQIEKANSEANE